MEKHRNVNRDLISAATRNRFREACVGLVFRQIEMFFEEAGFSPDLEYEPPVPGVRRTLVEQFYKNINFSSPVEVSNLVAVYAEVISHLDVTSKEYMNLIDRMERDGYRYVDKQFVPVAGSRLPNMSALLNHTESLNLTGVYKHVERINSGVANDPQLAIGESKNLIETICKYILDERKVSIQNDQLQKLVRSTLSELALLPDDIPEKAKGNETIRRVLSSLTQIVQGLAELRNLYGSGHGPGPNVPGVQQRHALLCVGAATTLAVFLLETHMARPNTL